MSDEQKQRYREARDKCVKYKYCNMSDEQKQKEKDYLREYYKKYYIEKKLSNKIIQHDDDDNYRKV